MRDVIMEAPTVARSLFGLPKLGARRCLFGSRPNVEQRQANRALIEKYQRIFRDSSENRWNFDFDKGEPLTGENNWERVQPCDMPEVYKRMCDQTERACATPPPKRRKLGPVNTVLYNAATTTTAVSVKPSSSHSATTGATTRSETSENRPAAEQPSIPATSSSSVQQEQESSPHLQQPSSRGLKRKQAQIQDYFAVTKKSSRRKLSF